MLRAVNDQVLEVEFCGALTADKKMEILQLLDLKKDAITICTNELPVNKGSCDNKTCFAYNMIKYVDHMVKEILSKLPDCNSQCNICNKV